jgi:hypothetical protein
VGMIKRQYDYYQTEVTYFTKFLNTLGDARSEVQEALKPWNATVAKSKARYRYNIKWHDPELYLLFALKYS